MKREGIMETMHKYQIRAISTTQRSGFAIAGGIEPKISFSAPPEFKGQAGYWTPEHLLVAAVASCFVSTFSGMALNSNFEFVSLELETVGTLVQDKGGWRFGEVTLFPRVIGVKPEQKGLGFRLLVKAKENCLVGRSLACPVIVEPAVIIEEEHEVVHQ
jgi:organic hydroperoxide reductase OsmC/OhrA